MCGQTPVRTDLWELAVWREVRALLEQPERLAEAYRRRWPPHAHARHHALTTVEGPLGTMRQGLARLIDSDAEGLIDTRAFEPRSPQRRHRVTTRDEPAHHLADEAALHTDLQRIIGSLEAFAAPVQDGLEDADWTGRRERIRALGKRLEVDHDQVHVVFRVDQRPGDLDPEKKRLQDCRRSTHSILCECATDSATVQGCTGWSPLHTDAEDASVLRANRGDQLPVERHIYDMAFAMRFGAGQALGV